MQLYCSLNIPWHCLSSGLEWKLTFSSSVTTIEFSKFPDLLSAVSSFRNLNSSAGIPSPPLGLYLVMLPKAHLTSQSRMSGSRLPRSFRPFLYSSYVYSCHLFLISSASVRSLLFMSFIVLSFEWNIPLISPIFLKWSLLFPILLLSSIALHCSLKEGVLVSHCYSLQLCIQWGIRSLSYFALAFLLP